MYVAADDTVFWRTSPEATEILVTGMTNNWERVKYNPGIIPFK